MCCCGGCNSGVAHPAWQLLRNSWATCETPRFKGGCDCFTFGGDKAVACPASSESPNSFDDFQLSRGIGCSNSDEILLESRDAAPTFSSVQDCADHCLNNTRCLQFNFQPEGAGDSRCLSRFFRQLKGKGTCFLHRERVQPAKCAKAPNPCFDLYAWQNPFAARHLEVVCPLIGASMNNGNLVPDPNTGLVARDQTRDTKRATWTLSQKKFSRISGALT